MKLEDGAGERKQYLGEDHEEWWFYCPGCKCQHSYIVRWGSKTSRAESQNPSWTFNRDMEKPTFNPSLLYTGTKVPSDEEVIRIMAGEKIIMPPSICHLYVTEGKIKFLSDCTHGFAGKTVEMKDV